MSLGDNKRALGQGKVERIPQNADSSIFKGKKEIGTRELRFQVAEDQKLFETTGLGREKRSKLIEKITDSRGSYFTKGEAEKVKRELDKGRAGEFRNFSPQEIEDAKKLMKGLLGK